LISLVSIESRGGRLDRPGRFCRDDGRERRGIMNGSTQHRNEAQPGRDPRRSPGVILIGRNRQVLAATPDGMRVVERAAVWVVETVKGRSRHMKFGDAVIAVLDGKAPSVTLRNPEGRSRTKGLAKLQIIPAYEGDGRQIIGAYVVAN
jgi:hypothetical protein